MAKGRLIQAGSHKYEYLGVKFDATFEDEEGKPCRTVQGYMMDLGGWAIRVPSLDDAMEAVDWWRDRWERGVLSSTWFATGLALVELWGLMPGQVTDKPEPQAAAPGVVLPIVHMNGSGKKNLLDAREDCREALLDAAHKLARMSPNGRDYYVESGLMERAERQQERRMNILAGLIHEIEQEMHALDAA